MSETVRTALVTGANRGIGLAVASGLAARGDIRVVASARMANDAERAAAVIGAGAVGAQLDLSDVAVASAHAAAIESAHGPIDILVNNGAILTNGSGLEITPDALIDSLTINTIGPFALIRKLGPGMKRRRWGRIVNVSSGWGAFSEGLTGPAAYSVSKAALNAVTVSLARTLAPEVKVNAACPGWVRTRMGGRGATRAPEEGADTIIWLATLPRDGPTGGFFRDRRPTEW